MAHIASMAEFAYVIRLTVTEAAAHGLLLDLAEGLVIEEIGDQDPWPTSARAVVLAASSRAFFNPAGVSSEQVGPHSRSFAAAQVGVYLTDEEIDRLHGKAGAKGPTFSFPGTWPYPDPAERETDTISG